MIMVGLPASGKSTLREAIGADCYHYSTDDKIDAYAAEVGSTYSEVFQEYAKEAQRLADAELATAITDRQNIVWDQTNMSAKKRRKILNQFDNSWRRECICILPPMDLEQEESLAARLASRPGKEIPDFVMRSMRNSFDLPSVNEGFNRVNYYNIYGTPVDRNVAAEVFGKS